MNVKTLHQRLGQWVRLRPALAYVSARGHVLPLNDFPWHLQTSPHRWAIVRAVRPANGLFLDLAAENIVEIRNPDWVVVQGPLLINDTLEVRLIAEISPEVRRRGRRRTSQTLERVWSRVEAELAAEDDDGRWALLQRTVAVLETTLAATAIADSARGLDAQAMLAQLAPQLPAKILKRFHARRRPLATRISELRRAVAAGYQANLASANVFDGFATGS